MKLKPQSTILIIATLLLLLSNSCNITYTHKAKHGKLIIPAYDCFIPYNINDEKLLTYKDNRKIYPFKASTFQDNTYKFISKNDSILSIGARDGAFEFMASFFVDSVKFYLEDIDTLCMSQFRIDNIYLPEYNNIKKDIRYYNLYTKKNKIFRYEMNDTLFTSRLNQPINCTYEYISGTDTSINAKNNIVNKVYINRTYHHFTKPEKMIEECSRILTDHGMLIIGEYVTLWDRKTWKHCSYGGYYKTEKNFIKHIESHGYKIDKVYKGKENWREFIFIKI